MKPFGGLSAIRSLDCGAFRERYSAVAHGASARGSALTGPATAPRGIGRCRRNEVPKIVHPVGAVAAATLALAEVAVAARANGRHNA